MENSSIQAQYKGHNPKSPEDDVAGRNLYIRLPDQQKLRKVRNTYYEDPGNPFGLDAFELSIIPSTSLQKHKNDFDNDRNIWEQWDSSETVVPESSQRTKQGISSMFSDPFDLDTAVDGVPGSYRSGSLSEVSGDSDFSTIPHRATFESSSTSSERRSMSVDIGYWPNEYRTTEQENSQEGESLSALQYHHPSGTIFLENNRRDTDFYDFYDDIFAGYVTQPKSAVMRLKQQPLPVSR